MPIICFEGASAVGKSTISAFLRDNHNAYLIPEVNLLFERKAVESKFWYFEKQIERWQLALSAMKHHEIVILDGDPFQPIWYNWAYDYDFGESFEGIMSFYQSALISKAMDFPHQYFILYAGDEELRRRKINDALRRRKNFERHLRFIKPQIAYFNFINSLNNHFVEFIENKEINASAERVINLIEDKNPGEFSSLNLFASIKNWLSTHKSEEFIF